MGRQPTSGYCQTCRKRRVKCDKARPCCGQCSVSGRRCGGYDLPLRMEVYGVHTGNNGARQLVRIPTASSKPPSAPTPELRLNHVREELEAAPAYFFATWNWAPFFRPLLLSAASDEFPEINKICFRAISQGYAGRSVGDGALQNKGRLLYGRVLSEVQLLLQEPAKPRLARLGFTMIMMEVYEFTINKVRGGSPPHHVGLTHILHHCGPETFQERRLLELYRCCRAMLICQALYRQSRCFLEDTPWKTVPWRHAHKTFEDRLADIMIHMPGIAEALAVPQNRPSSLDKIKTLSAALHEWRWDWHAANSACVRRVRDATASLNDAHLAPETPALVRHMLRTTLEFDTPRQALDILYYNAAIIYLAQLDAAARGQRYPYPELLTSADQRYIRRYVAADDGGGSGGNNSNPLLLPGQARFRCQAAAEAFTTLSCVTRLLATTPGMETVVTPSAIGIVYWVLRDQMQLLEEHLQLLLSRYAIFRDPERDFGGYFVKVGDGET
ncbi:hypothetical protein N658DRAFT_496834 [Parathielavia hyrcaniae]|uniref:Zn(2)-C6 fungal-type domain-containing protein n=1 Tax=Parathielavia hyrcaniae TaxID=113614 RepID=A0AAN6Q039_9PEZI|nr:hypothetical protein N658DRAFT_496834 [Parathielavia hyrcaniae]